MTEILEPVLHIFTSPICSFFLVERHLPIQSHPVASRTIGARDFIHHIGLKLNRRPKLGGRGFLLKGLVRSSNNVNYVLSKKTCKGFCDTTDIRKADHGGEIHKTNPC